MAAEHSQVSQRRDNLSKDSPPRVHPFTSLQWFQRKGKSSSEESMALKEGGPFLGQHGPLDWKRQFLVSGAS